MKILSFFISPIKWALFLGMLAALVYYRSIIFHPNLSHHIDKAIAYTEERFEISIPSHVSGFVAEAEPVVVKECDSVDLAVNDSASDLVNDIAPAADAEQENENENEVTSLVEDFSEAVAAVNSKAEELLGVSKDTETAEQTVVQDNELKEVSAVNDVADADPTASAGSDIDPAIESDANALMFMARQSFWNGNTDDAEKRYIDLSNIDSANPDVYGELGNVYYAQGKWKQAGEAYYQAAVRLLSSQDDSKKDRVSYLLRVIQGLDADSAAKLRKKISG
ncbi:MAG: hypothetical protein OQK69_01645 [Gammaproteobacteria bacterium]|nr:hypothetical protein [Gammaproteobacteria bacterium]